MAIIKIFMILVILPCVHGNEGVNISFAHFETFSCSGDEARSIITLVTAAASNPTASRSLVECAAECVEIARCEFAVFRGAISHCNISRASSRSRSWNGQEWEDGDDEDNAYGGSSSGSEPLPDFISETGCVVLAKVVDIEETRQNQQCSSSEELWEIGWIGLPSMLDFEILPVKLRYPTARGSQRIVSFSYITNNDDDGILATPVLCLSVDALSGSFSTSVTNPFTFEVSLFQKESSQMITALLTADGYVYEAVSRTGLQSEEEMVINNPKVVYAETFEDVQDALMKGYRPMEREPTRVMINTTDEDVILFLTDTFRIDTVDDMNEPFNHKSYRLSLKTGRRQVYTYNILNGQNPSVSEEIVQKITWKFDPCWEKLDVESSYLPIRVTIELIQKVMEGREIRVLILGIRDGPIVTDITRVTVTTSDVIVHWVPYLTPFDAPDHDTRKNRQSWWLSSSGAASYCEHSVYGNMYLHGESNASFPYDVEWIFSTKPWTFLLRVDNEGGVLFGDSSRLQIAVAQGKTIRTCFKQMTEDYVVCFTAISAEITPGEHVLVQSPAASTLFTKSSGLLFGFPMMGCRTTVYMVSSEGWVKIAKFEDSVEVEESVDVDDIKWFIN